MQPADPAWNFRALTTGRRRAALRPGRRETVRRRHWVWLLSAVLHAMLLAALLTWRSPLPEQQLPPPDDVALVFEHPSRIPPKTEVPAKQTELPSRGEPRPLMPAPPVPAPPVQQPVPALPAPAIRTPPTAAPAIPRPPAPAPMLAPKPAPEPAPHPPPQPAPARPAPRPQVRSAFPQPMMRSWSLGAAGAAESSHPRTTQAERGTQASDNYDVRGAEALGPDWLNEFSEWVEEHKRYPAPAAANDEDGTNQVMIRIRRDGHVEEVGVLQRSGSQWLDMGTLSLFRDRRLPPFPPDASDNEITIQFTMHYIIVR